MTEYQGPPAEVVSGHPGEPLAQVAPASNGVEPPAEADVSRETPDERAQSAPPDAPDGRADEEVSPPASHEQSESSDAEAADRPLGTPAGEAHEPADVSRETPAPGTEQPTESLDAPVSRETSTGDFAAPIEAPAPDPDTPIAHEAAEAVRVLNIRQEHWPRPPAPRIFTVANQKGGVGKTTSTVNIAAALALHGVRVLVIDLDPQGNASTALGIDHSVGTPSIYDVLLGGRPIADVTTTADFAPLLQCVPATLDLAGADIELTSQVAREYRLQRALNNFLAEQNEMEASERIDYVFIDCPPSLGLLTLNALVAAREVLIPIQCEYYALEGLAQLLNTVELVTSHLNPALTVTTVLLTMYDSRTRLADQVADEVRNHFGELVLAPTIPRNVRVSEAPGFGQTVITYDPGSRGAIGYLQAAREIADRGAAKSSTGESGEQ